MNNNITILKANDKAKATINFRYLLIVFIALLLTAAFFTDKKYNDLFANPGKHELPNYFIFFLLLNILYYVFIIQRGKFNRIIRSIELGYNTIKIVTFPFDIKYYPFKRKAIEFEIDKDKVDYKKAQFDFTLINNLPFFNYKVFRVNNGFVARIFAVFMRVSEESIYFFVPI